MNVNREHQLDLCFYGRSLFMMVVVVFIGLTVSEDLFEIWRPPPPPHFMKEGMELVHE